MKITTVYCLSALTLAVCGVATTANAGQARSAEVPSSTVNLRLSPSEGSLHLLPSATHTHENTDGWLGTGWTSFFDNHDHDNVDHASVRKTSRPISPRIHSQDNESFVL